jgi:prepilin-type N-terminal cleavage/methylation domain-containing protein
MELAHLPAEHVRPSEPPSSLVNVVPMTRRSGFTIIELVVTIVVAAALLTLVSRALGDVQRRIAADQAMKTYEAMHARARAHAVERGTTVRLILDTAGDSASVVLPDGEVLETVHFQSELGVDVQSGASNPVEVCMTARGYGDASCMSFNGTVTLSFASGRDTVALQLLPLGQIKR